MNKLKYYIKRAYHLFNQREMRILPGNMAFFFMLALIPILTILATILSKFNISMDVIIKMVNELLPKDASSLIIDTISGKSFDSNIGILNIVVLFITSNGTYSIINASNTLYRVGKSDVLKDRIKSLLLLSILLFLIVFIISVPILGGKILKIFVKYTFYNDLKIIYNIIKWPLTFVILYMNIKLIYTIAPSTTIKSSTTTYGALFTTIIWVLATIIFNYYLKYFANYNAVYGSLSSIIILIIWLYLISYVFVIGIAINASDVNS